MTGNISQHQTGYASTVNRKSFLDITALLLLLCLLPGASAASADQPVDSKLQFAVIGDSPYNADQEKEFTHLMEELNNTDLAFVIHVGDFWYDGLAWNEGSKGLPPCSDETLKDRLSMAKSSTHPFIFVPGDNEWTDCHRAKPKAYDPIERLEKLRHMFYPDDNSLGKQVIPLTRQSAVSEYADFRENVRWIQDGVLFMTLHIVGSNNNLGRTEDMDNEYTKRNSANLTWLNESFAYARKNEARAVVIFAHANPHFENGWPATLQNRYLLKGLGLEPAVTKRETGYDEFLSSLEQETLEFAKPVFYVHGDTHTFRIDKPLVDSFSGRMIENFTRVETFGFPDTHWIRVTIDPNDPGVLRFSEGIVKKNLVEH